MRLVLLLFLAISLTACRKDLLHWQSATRLESGTTQRINKLLVIDRQTILAVGGERFNTATISISRDAGATWLSQTFPDAGKGMYGCVQRTDGVLYAVGFDSKMLISNDTGRTWTFRQVGIYTPMKAIAAPQPNRLVMVGGVSFTQGERIYTDATGAYYRRDTAEYEMTDVVMVDERKGYIAGTGIFLKTEDSMKTWEVQQVRDDNFQAISTVGDKYVFTCGINGSIWCSSNGGNTWERRRNGNDITLPRYKLTDLVFRNEKEGYAVGESGTLIYTTDGGRHWMEHDRFTRKHLYCITLLGDGNLVVAGEAGEMWKLLP